MNTSGNRTVLSLCAHPDDAEFLCAGTLALLRRAGWTVHIATLTPGDCGSKDLPREQIGAIRRAEAAKAASRLDGTYHCLDCDDIFILYDRPTLLKAVELVRRVQPAIVFTLSPSDYMVDHEMASRIARTACFTAGVPNVATPGVEPFHQIPHLYYADPLGGQDILGNAVSPRWVVDISETIDTKEKMLCCHESQRQWLLAHHGVDEYTLSMKRFAAERGALAGCQWGEGFRQHLGHAFPEDNILASALPGKVHNWP